MAALPGARPASSRPCLRPSPSPRAAAAVAGGWPGGRQSRGPGGGAVLGRHAPVAGPGAGRRGGRGARAVLGLAEHPAEVPAGPLPLRLPDAAAVPQQRGGGAGAGGAAAAGAGGAAALRAPPGAPLRRRGRPGHPAVHPHPLVAARPQPPHVRRLQALPAPRHAGHRRPGAPRRHALARRPRRRPHHHLRRRAGR